MQVNRDCWYVYTLARGDTATIARCVDLPSVDQQQRRADPDQTIEILMTELDVNIMSIFTKEGCASAKDATERSGIHKILPGMVIDDFLFEPCGYSMNGVSKAGLGATNKVLRILCLKSHTFYNIWD